MFKKLFSKRPEPRVELLPSGVSFAVGKNKTVLEQALENGIAYPHDCTVGTCGSCRSRLISGKVDAITPFGYTLSREELREYVADNQIADSVSIPQDGESMIF